MTDAIVDKIRTRGYWRVRIHPDAYVANRLSRLADIESAVKTAAVSLRGWEFPHYDLRVDPLRSADYVEQMLDWHHYVEGWRASKSGQFISLSGLRDDWRDQSDLWPPPPGWRSGATLSVEDTVFRLTEIFEFAVRWSQALRLEDTLLVDVTLHGLEGRALHLDLRRSGFSYPRVCKVPSWAHSSSYASAVLLTQHRELAIPLAISLFELFGWDVSPEIVRGIQGELRS